MQPVNGGYAWVRETAFRGSSRDWRLVRRDGAEAARVSLPVSMRVFDQAGDTVWAGDVDQLGVHFVVGLLLRPGGAR